MNSIQLNQLGYRPNDPKKAVIPEDCAEFSVVKASDNAVIYSGNASEPMFCEASGETMRIADFSGVTQIGEYKLITKTGGSYSFLISDNPYGGLRKAILDFFHYQKCGVELEAGVWSHSACHTPPAFVIDKNGEKTGEVKDVSGGWHDAGDYGRYIIPAAMTVAQLLLGYELAANPDGEVLDIVWFELEWMLKMQDEATGGVYHKVSCRRFNPLDEMPDKELDELVISPISATATADFAASIALASRFYPEHKEKLLDAAERAWVWCVNNPDAEEFHNPPGVYTGGYGDDGSEDERFWAACELYAATGKEEYHDYIKAAEIFTGLGWRDMGGYGIIAYLLHAKEKADNSLSLKMKEELLSVAREALDMCGLNPYGISLGMIYPWGSNMYIANGAMLFLIAGILDKDNKEEYEHAALEQINYLLGKNALNQCYISGFGSNPMKNPHHRPSVAVGKTVPGMVSGGPNGYINAQSDPVLRIYCAGQPPMKCFVDHIESCSSNEITIYWNSPVYFVLAFLGL